MKTEKFMECSGNRMLGCMVGEGPGQIDQELAKALNGRMRDLCIPTVRCRAATEDF